MALRPRINVEEILTYLNVPRSTWDKWRKRGVGPQMHRLPNGSLWTFESDFEDWLNQLDERAA